MPKDDFMSFKRKLDKIVPRPLANKSLLKTSGIDENAFNEGFDKLCSIWWDVGASFTLDCTGKRLVTNTLASKLNDPIILSIIADDVNYFKDHYKTKKLDIFYLEFCCLCGAEKIIKNIYLEDSDKKQCLIRSENAVGYALSSGNGELAIDLAKKIKSLGKITPGQLILYSSTENYSQAELISKMFAVGNTPTNEELDTKKPRLV